MPRGRSILLALGAVVLFTTSATGASLRRGLLSTKHGHHGRDSSGNGNNGTYTGGSTLGTAAPNNLARTSRPMANT